MTKYSKMINSMVNLYRKNILFAYLFSLIAVVVTGLLFYHHFRENPVPTTFRRVGRG